jgi:hypothetical protein
MGQTPTSKSAIVNSAAKDDTVGGDFDNGFYTFTLNDLLANDPGGANKNGNLFFGSDPIKQADYMTLHGITKISGEDGGTYTVKAGMDFDYSVQMGNKGTWSTAHVDVADAPPPPAGQLGEEIARWNFEDTAAYPQAVNAPTGWFNVSDYAENNHLGTYAKTMEVVDGTNGPITGYGTGEHQWLDTAASPGNIWIQLEEANRTTNLAADHEAKLFFSVSKQQFGDGSGGSNGGENSHTDPNAFVEFLWNYEVVAMNCPGIAGGYLV